MVAEFIDSRKRPFLHIDGYLYYFVREKSGRMYWKCRKGTLCSARAITSCEKENFVVFQGPYDTDNHTASNHVRHAPDFEEVNALKVVKRIKRHAKEHPEAPPAQIIRTELHNVESGILSHLPDRPNLRKSITRERLKSMPCNPQRLEDLYNIPGEYRQSLKGERFLLYDSYEDDDYPDDGGRILIFSTTADLRKLFRCNMWFADGTFSSAPTIFYQFFAIMGAVAQENKELAFPFVYALLQDKKESSYRKVFDVIISKARDFKIKLNFPSLVMSDFELGVMNAVKTVMGEERVKGCFFHLCQSVYRQVQQEGLQAQYNNPEDRSVKTACHMLTALAFVPPEDVIEHFETLLDKLPEEVMPIADYLELIYIRGRPV